MSKYIEMLEFFVENGISLNTDQIEALNEKFFDRGNKTVYSCSVIIDKDNVSNNKSVKDAIIYWICACYSGKLENGVIIFPKESFYKQLVDENKYIYISKFNHKYNPKGITYGEQHKYKFISVEDKGNVMSLISKYSIKTKVKDNGIKEDDREKIYKDACKIANKVILDLSKSDPNIKKGFNVVNHDEYDLSDFINGIDNYIDIIYCDAWSYTNNKARDEEEYNKYQQALDNVVEEFKNRVKFAKVEYDGDWDDGCLEIYL